jgi:PAS domain S-box-containing protein
MPPETDELTDTDFWDPELPARAFRPCLEVVDSRDIALLGRFVPIGDSLSVGRAAAANLRIQDPSISREHARFQVAAGQVSVVDLGSTNGTMVNGALVERAELETGDLIQIGLHTVFRFARESSRWSLGVTDAILPARIALWEWDAGTGAVCASVNFEQVTGFAPEDIPAGPAAILELVHPGDRARAREAVRSLSGGSSAEIELRIPAAGDQPDVWLGIQAQIAQSGGRLTVSGSVSNQSRRKRAERELRRMTRVLENMYDALVVVDLDGRITDWTARAAATFSLSRDQVLGVPLGDLVGAGHFHALEEAVADRGHYTGEIPVSRPSGATRVYEVAAAPLRDDGWVVGYVAAFRDVTARKALHEQVVASDKLAAIGTLAAGIAHEINNPLSFVAGGLDWLAERIAALEDRANSDLAAMREVLGEMRGGVGRIAGIVGSLRVFSRQGDQPSSVPVQLAQVVRLAERIVANEVRQVAQLRIAIPDDVYVVGDETRMMQVFINLIINAVHAIESGDHVHNAIEIRLERREGGAAIVTVRDTGVGMTGAVMDRAFHPFFTTKPAGKGTGLGLGVTRTIVESAGGDISLDSQPGRGTCVRLSLPLARSPLAELTPPAGTAGATAGSAGRAGAVLVIDDEPMVASALSRLLASRGFETVIANDGTAGIELALAGGFDAILCDLMMPDVSGIDVHQRLLATRPDLAERIVFVSGGAFTEREQAFVEETRRPVVGKPWSPDALLAAIHQAAPGP